MLKMTTTIQISDEQWRKLVSLKERPNDTFINVLNKVLKLRNIDSKK